MASPLLAQEPPVPGPPAQKAKTNLSLFVGSSDYPEAALQARQEGTVAFALNVTPFGRVAACRVVRSSGVAELDEG